MQRIIVVILIFVMLTSCLSEQERNVKNRESRLDSLLNANKPNIELFFKTLITGSQITPNKQLIIDTAQLNPNKKVIYNKFKTEYISHNCDSTLFKQLSIKYVTDTTFLVLYCDSSKASNQEAVSYIQFIKNTDIQNIFKIHDRLKGEEWADAISNPSDFTSEETRNADAYEIEKSIKQLGKIKYLLVIENIMQMSPQLTSETEFKSGSLFSKIHVFDVNTSKKIGEFYFISENSFMVIDTKYNNEKLNVSDLIEDLQYQHSFSLFKIFTEN